MAIKRSRISEDFTVSDRVVELALMNGWPDPDTEVEAFKDYHLAKGSLMADWEAAFRTWLRNAARWNNGTTRRQIDRPSVEPKGFASVRGFLANHSNDRKH